MFPFSFHVWSTINYFSISPHNIAFLCSSSLTFNERHVLFVYFTTTERDGVHTVLGHVEFCWWLDILQRVEPLVNTVLMSYGLHIFWILSIRVDILWRVFRYHSPSSYEGFLEPILCFLGSCCDGGCVKLIISS